MTGTTTIASLVVVCGHDGGGATQLDLAYRSHAHSENGSARKPVPEG